MVFLKRFELIQQLSKVVGVGCQGIGDVQFCIGEVANGQVHRYQQVISKQENACTAIEKINENNISFLLIWNQKFLQ